MVGHSALHCSTRFSWANGFGIPSRLRKDPGLAKFKATGLTQVFFGIGLEIFGAMLAKFAVENMGGTSAGK